MLEAVWITGMATGTTVQPSCTRFSVPAELKAVRDVRRRVGDFARAHGFGSEEVETIQTAVGEAALNGIKHGSPHGSSDSVFVSCRYDSEGITIEVADTGTGFDPDSVPTPVAENFRSCGYGVSLMRGLMDDVTFNRYDDGTTVRLFKRLSHPH
ncbi:MAG TPA: ATP-binding protein [Armatimonadota bacterium]|jgi:serine/threonine-protein kinase RsbW